MKATLKEWAFALFLVGGAAAGLWWIVSYPVAMPPATAEEAPEPVKPVDDRVDQIAIVNNGCLCGQEIHYVLQAQEAYRMGDHEGVQALLARGDVHHLTKGTRVRYIGAVDGTAFVRVLSGRHINELCHVGHNHLTFPSQRQRR